MTPHATQGYAGGSLSSGRTVIFQHIPKTAGSTLHAIFNRKCRRRETYNVFGGDFADDEIQEFRRLPKRRRQGIELLKGHMPFGLHRDLPQESAYVTLLREPVSRVVSQYKYIWNNPDNHLHEEVVGNDMTLGEFVESGISAGMDNGQVRWLAGEVHGWAFGEVGEDELKQAKEHVRRHYALVGLTERFDATVLMLRKLMGWVLYPFYVERNVSDDQRTQVSFDEGDIEVVKRHHRFDARLYDFVVNRFEAQIDAVGVREEDIRGFSQWNRAYTLAVRPWLRVYEGVKRRI